MHPDSSPGLAVSRHRGLHNIGEAAARSGVGAKTIRYYESIGLIPEAGRTFAGYRLYSDADVLRFRFIRHARTLGFSIKQIQVLLELWNDHARSNAELSQLAKSHIDTLAKRIHQMQAMQRTLQELMDRCRGDTRPGCPILDDVVASMPGAANATVIRTA